jgi:hypothetical protein
MALSPRVAKSADNSEFNNEHLPDQLQLEGIDPKLPWLYGFQHHPFGVSRNVIAA